MALYHISLYRSPNNALAALVKALGTCAASVVAIETSTGAVTVQAQIAEEFGQDRLERVCQELADSLHCEYAIKEGDVAEEQVRWRITLLADRRFPPAVVEAVIERIAGQGLHIDTVRCLTHTHREDRCAWAIHCSGQPIDAEHLRASLHEISEEHRVDCNWVADDIASRLPRLVVFDMDSTLIQCECIDELAKRAGTGEQVSAITEAAMRGELDFTDSFRERLGTLQGLPETEMAAIADTLPYTEGVDILAKGLKALGAKLVVASGGFTYFADQVAQRLGFDAVAANVLEFADGALTGKYIGEVVDGKVKARVLEEKAAEWGIPIQQTMAVGDGANDLLMMQAAATGVAFHAKPIVLQQAPQRLSCLGLDAVLYLLGWSDADIESL